MTTAINDECEIRKYKYPSTPHLSCSPAVENETDKLIFDEENFIGKTVVATIKMDGENFTLYNDGISHARSLDSGHHPSRSWIKNYHATFSDNIPHGYRICGENLYAKHSIHYTDLHSYFYGFSIWKEDICCNFVETMKFFNSYKIIHAPLFYIGEYNLKLILETFNSIDIIKEGFVIRNANAFTYQNFSKNVAKYVRKNHVTTSEHWMYQPMIKNELNCCPYNGIFTDSSGYINNRDIWQTWLYDYDIILGNVYV